MYSFISCKVSRLIGKTATLYLPSLLKKFYEIKEHNKGQVSSGTSGSDQLTEVPTEIVKRALL